MDLMSNIYNSLIEFDENAVNFIESYQSYFFIIFASMIGKITEYSKRNILSAWTIYFIGTFFHELAHFIVSALTYGKPYTFMVFPKTVRDNKKKIVSYVLGSVSSKNVRWYNVALISLAPLVLFFLSFWVYNNFFFYVDKSATAYMAYVFLVVTLAFNAIPSNIDFLNIFTNITYDKKTDIYIKKFKIIKILNLIPIALLIYIGNYTQGLT